MKYDNLKLNVKCIIVFTVTFVQYSLAEKKFIILSIHYPTP